MVSHDEVSSDVEETFDFCIFGNLSNTILILKVLYCGAETT